MLFVPEALISHSSFLGVKKNSKLLTIQRNLRYAKLSSQKDPHLEAFISQDQGRIFYK